MDADAIRELVARHEGPFLDFKRQPYDSTPAGNRELAKDIMAIANGLAPHNAAGHILIGVEEAHDGTGRIVGVPAASHLNDADMQNKVHALLNRTPYFSYYPVEVDGLSVGVFEILPVGRPFYALRDQGNDHKLSRFHALLRQGTSTDIASPDQIQNWLREDELADRRTRLHQGLSRFLGFLVEAIDGNPFHWSKHALHCKPLSEHLDTVRSIKNGIDAQTYQMHGLQIKAVIESAHEASEPLRALISTAFQLSGEHGLVWLSINSSVSQLAGLYPFDREKHVIERHPIKRGEDTFALAFYEFLEVLIRFEEARQFDWISPDIDSSMKPL